MKSRQVSPRLFLATKTSMVLLFLLSVLNSCQVHLVPSYSADLEAQIVNAAKMTDKLYLEMIDAPADKKNYALYSDQYIAIETEIHSILLINQNRDKAKDIVNSVTILSKKFAEYKDDHKKRDTLSNGELIAYNADLQAFWAPVLVEEQALSKAR